MEGYEITLQLGLVPSEVTIGNFMTYIHYTVHANGVTYMWIFACTCI